MKQVTMGWTSRSDWGRQQMSGNSDSDNSWKRQFGLLRQICKCIGLVVKEIGCYSVDIADRIELAYDYVYDGILCKWC
jgi:hypothetical protein